MLWLVEDELRMSWKLSKCGLISRAVIARQSANLPIPRPANRSNMESMDCVCRKQMHEA